MIIVRDNGNGLSNCFEKTYTTLQRYRKQGKVATVTSERQKAANQANALHSTGPKTQEGKAVVRLNALRHGLLARDVVLPGEDADAFEDLWNQVRANFSPVGPIEELLVDRIVNAMWRLQRLARAETALFHWRVHELKANRLAKQVCSYEKTFLDGLSGLSFSAPEITDKASHAWRARLQQFWAQGRNSAGRRVRLGCTPLVEISRPSRGGGVSEFTRTQIAAPG